MKTEIQLLHDAIIKYYNHLTGSEATMMNEIPQKALSMICCFEYEELIRPFVIAEIQQGKSMTQLAIKYRVSRHIIRGIGRKQYLYSRVPKCTTEEV